VNDTCDVKYGEGTSVSQKVRWSFWASGSCARGWCGDPPPPPPPLALHGDVSNIHEMQQNASLTKTTLNIGIAALLLEGSVVHAHVKPPPPLTMLPVMTSPANTEDYP
jgi:hypothetical protein